MKLKSKIMNSRILRFLLVVLLSGLVGYTIGVNKIKLGWANFQPQIQVTSKEPPSSFSQVNFTQFWTVMEKLQNTYYDKTKIDAQKILNGAITGMVESLDDPYTVYLPPKENDDFKDVMAGKFEGIGAELDMKDKQIIVVSPLDGSPAKKAGIQAGDAILEVDEKPTSGWTLNKAVDNIRGPKGTSVSLLIFREKEKTPRTVKIVRDTITINSITSWIKPVKEVENITLTDPLKQKQNEKVAYIRLSQFGDSANKEWVTAANNISMARKQDPNIKGVILDLRNNPGGYLNHAVFISSEFISSGTIVMEEDREGERRSMEVSREGLLLDIPVVVLINKGSASASEIVSGALRDHNRAVLVGETSFGKGTIQQAEDLGGGAGLHITIAKWLTPKGTWVHDKGLKPDIEVALNEKEPKRDTQLERAIQELVNK